MNIVVTCGYNSSKHTLTLLYLLKKEGIIIDKCIIVSALSVKRLKVYYRQLDRRELLKKLKDRILSNVVKIKVSDEMKYVLKMYADAGIKENKVTNYCRNNGIKYKVVKNLNHQSALNFIGYNDLAIYSGGGIVRKGFLQQFKIGVLNCHSGKLPEIRGMNSGEWSTLLNIPYFNTLHFMVREIDLGPIIALIAHDYSTCITINQLRGKAVEFTILDLIYGTKKIISDNYTLTHQKKEEGKQYYVMHPILKNVVNKKLAFLNACKESNVISNHIVDSEN